MSQLTETVRIVKTHYEEATLHRNKMAKEMKQVSANVGVLAEKYSILVEQYGALIEQLQEVIKARNFWQEESLKKDVEIIQKDREIEELKKKIPVKATPSYETLVSSQ